MVSNNYESIIEKISRISGVDKDELHRKVEAKRAKLSGLISKEGAAQVIAAELGISFDNEKLKISELIPGMRKVNTSGKVINIFPVREFNKNGKSGKVVNFVLADNTGNVRAVLWDVNHIELIEKNKIKVGSVVEIVNASMRESEVHLGSFSDLKISNEIFDNVVTEKLTKPKSISDFKINDRVNVRAFVVHSFEPRFFNVCSKCNKKVTPEGNNFICAEHGNVPPRKRALMNFILDDGTETIRTVAFSDQLDQMGMTEMENPEKLMNQREDLLGREMVFSGNVRNNTYFNNTEFILDSAKNLDLDEMITGLEKS